MGAWGIEMSDQTHDVYLEAREIADPEKPKACSDRTYENAAELWRQAQRRLADEARADDSFIEEDPDQAQKFTTSLSKVYRYVLEQKY